MKRRWLTQNYSWQHFRKQLAVTTKAILVSIADSDFKKHTIISVFSLNF
jgi:hypothetical protein